MDQRRTGQMEPKITYDRQLRALYLFRAKVSRFGPLRGGSTLEVEVTSPTFRVETSELELGPGGWEEIEVIHADQNLLTSGDVTFPPRLTSLYLSFNLLGNPPSQGWPSQITILEVARCYLKTLGVLPPSLRRLNASGNFLVSIESLPAELVYADLSANLLEVLPSPLPPDLQTLNVRHNALTYLPDLPLTLASLSCGENALRELPRLVHLPLTHLTVPRGLDIQVPPTVTFFEVDGDE